jgi:hypothetical protein
LRDSSRRRPTDTRQQLGTSAHQFSYVTHTNPGENLLFCERTVIPFADRFPKDTELYRMMATHPDEADA